MPYEWDEAKRQINLEIRGIDFEEIERFQWETSLKEEQIRYGERRTLALGYIGNRLHVVVYTARGGNTRIISMRKASPREMRRYAQA